MAENSNQQIPKDAADLTKEEEKISPIAATSNALKDYENKSVVFSFEIYNHNQCEIANLDKIEAKKLTKELKKMSKTLTKNFRHQGASGIACKSISNSGRYSVFFNEVQEDTEMLEVDFSGTGRVFGFIVNNIFNIVAITKLHR